MEEERQDVNPQESVQPEQQDVKEEAQETIQPEQPVEETQIPEPSLGQEDVDEMGVPYKNRYMEAQRKMGKLEEKLETILQNTSQQTQNNREYSIEELEAFAETTDDPAHKTWAKAEIRRKEKQEQEKLFQKYFRDYQEKQKSEQIKQQSFRSVIQRNPELAVKDQAGNFVRWNQNSQLFKRINQYMQNPRIQSQPDALEIAEAFAIRDLSRLQKPEVQKKLQETNDRMKALQKQTMVEGGGNSPQQSMTPRQAALAKLRDAKSTGKDVSDALGHILRDAGHLPG